MKIKNIILLSLLFLIINIGVYALTYISSQTKIDIVLTDNLKTLKTHYKILLETQRTTSKAIYKTTINMSRVIEIVKEANSASKEKKAILRKELHEILRKKYEIIKEKGVLQYHFLLTNNVSFYRAHKPSKFGDDLTKIRADFEYTNRTKKPIRGFTQGRTAHGFRNTFPLFDKNNTHIGAIEISFSSDSFQWYLNNISGIHTHFIVDKHLFNTKAWKRDDLILKYKQSSEEKNYMLTLNTLHTQKTCIDENKIKLKPIRKTIEDKILLGETFSSYIKDHNHILVISFLPIKNLSNKTVAWIVSYEKSPIIKSALLNAFVLRIATFFISILIIYLLIKQILSKQKLHKTNEDLKNQHKLLEDILNVTEDIMIITDFKDVKFLNDKFKDTLDIQNLNNFNKLKNHNILSIFINTDGYLHEGLLKKGETFNSLIHRTHSKDKIVSILDKNAKQVSFKISIAKLENKNDYLVTLSDITKMKEHQIQTEVKAYTDTLTQVYNRTKFDEILEKEIENSKKYNSSFSIALIDIDKFKDFNDSYGHLIGDEVLISMAHVVNENVRGTDVFARWGGEEFVILFKNASLDISKRISEKLKDLIQKNEHKLAGKITASFGVTEYIDGDTMDKIFKRCDDALYIAKRNGRNRVESL